MAVDWLGERAIGADGEDAEAGGIGCDAAELVGVCDREGVCDTDWYVCKVAAAAAEEEDVEKEEE